MNSATLISLVAGPGRRAPASAPTPLEALFERNLLQHRRLFAALDALRDDICQAAVLLSDTLHRGGRLLFFGSGGSAADSQRLAADFNARLQRQRGPLAALALNADSATVTAIADDFGYEQIFARQLLAHGRPGDCAVALAARGDTAHLLRALEAAQAQGVASVALLGGDGGRARALADLAVVVPHHDGARVQEAHLFIGHTLCGQVESALGLVAS